MSILLGIAAVGLAASVIKKRQAANELYGSMVTQAVKDQVNSARQQGILDELENSRQDIINPYEDVKDLSGDMSNSFNNLGVATQAAEMQMEQSDIALANTLDTLRATGAGAGGATALAQAALQSKKGVAASIESQESENQKLRAQGEEMLQRQKIAEKQRVQDAEVKGAMYEFESRETRETAKLDRQADLADQARAQDRETQNAVTMAKYQKQNMDADMFMGASYAASSV
tara:strand:- start:1360 stop:2052 length:693 start_codon:yes stop_codon:yes gene_type:complete